ncbi:VENN motif pre-toxin domain-containing protein [Exercitatus varius]|uniref:VENN motif pre-toxin domain-containing protein n=1 Tax=Exercitatus varius TaxID=67857 RepID=UPI00294B67F3|nr:VENN motif pre-toxin domain-containing protein [Exercitatus varius]MDG2959186.1 VENN motif pre-toxin domain-containing protein [Exercitatus varius]
MVDEVQRYDKANYEERLETAQLIGDISQNQIDIQWTPKVREAEAKRQQAEAVLNNQNATTAEKTEARQIKSQSEQIINTYGKGGDYQLAVRAVTGVLQGLATGNQNAAWANGLSPYANNLIKTYTTDESGQVNTTANLMAHAMLGALEAYATGNHAAAGAAGAVTSEVAAKLITEQLYHTDPSKLTDDQKQVVATLSQVTAGLAGIVTSDSTQSAVSAAEIGKRAVENNYNAVPFVENIDGNSLKAMAEIQTQQAERNESVRALIEREHPIIYKGGQDTYYILSKTGEVIYIAREIVMDVAPMLLAPEIAVGTKFYTIASRVALSGAANVVAQSASGQSFNWVELGGSMVSGVVTPSLRTTNEMIRFNAGVGMAVGLANGGDGLTEAGLSGIAAYSATKISNPIWASVVSETIQKAPNIRDSILKKEKSEGK